MLQCTAYFTINRLVVRSDDEANVYRDGEKFNDDSKQSITICFNNGQQSRSVCTLNMSSIGGW